MKKAIAIIVIAFVLMASTFVPENEPLFNQSDTIRAENTTVIVCSNNFTDSTTSIYIYSGEDSIHLVLDGNRIVSSEVK